MSPADSPDRPVAPTDGPPPAPDPHSTAAPNTAGATPPDPDDAVVIGGTVVQTGPPSHLVTSPVPSNLSSTRDHSGREVRRLDRLIDRSRDPDATDLAPGYKLLESIGTGAFGSVWQAENLLTGEHVAIKFFAAGDEQWGKLLEEVRRLQELEGSQGIVMVKQVARGGVGRPPYYVMQLANRGSLARRIDEAKKAAAAGADRAGPVIPQDEAVRIFSRVAAAMAAVHRRGVHHCDLKPRNVLLHRTHDDGPDEPLIADFGQAHLATDDTPALGTFFYMPPDQAAAAQANALPDTRWDVYALGAILYEMLTGETPRRHGELVAKLKNTEHLDSKLQAYRDGIAGGPEPVAHRKLVDPLLARIIDRCLDLDPGKRPRSAGQVCDLLRQRAWWRQTRPILALGTAATVLFLLLLVGISAFVGTAVYEDTRARMTADVQGSLARTAWFGRPLIEERLRRHVGFVEREAATKCPPAVRQALKETRDKFAAAKYDPADVPGRAAFDQWLGEFHDRLRKGWVGEDVPGLSLMVVIPAGDGAARGYHVARRHPNGDRQDVDQPDGRWDQDYSYRDYFNGAGERPDRDRPHPAVRHTHFSHTYRSIDVDLLDRGDRDERPWRLDVTTPVWADPDAKDEVIGLLLLRLNVGRHLVSHLEPPRDQLPGGAAAAGEVRVVLIDDRQRWVWHRDGMKHREDTNSAEGPDHYPTLVADLGGDAAGHAPWAVPGRDPPSARYVDPVQAAQGERSAEFARWEAVRPYARSEYPQAQAREWRLVVQVDEAKALEPLAVLRYNMIVTGSVVVLALAALAAGLWAWLIRVLRGREFATHG